MSNTEKKACVVCGEGFRGRHDKRFCSDHCRSTFHNRQNSDQTNFMRNINNTLRKNRRILAALNPNGKARVHRDKLLEKGFNFNYYTSSYVTYNKHTYCFVYDQGYFRGDDDYYVLVVRQKYME